MGQNPKYSTTTIKKTIKNRFFFKKGYKKDFVLAAKCHLGVNSKSRMGPWQWSLSLNLAALVQGMSENSKITIKS